MGLAREMRTLILTTSLCSPTLTSFTDGFARATNHESLLTDLQKHDCTHLIEKLGVSKRLSIAVLMQQSSSVTTLATTPS